MHNIIFIFTFSLIFVTITLTQLKQTNQLKLKTHFYETLIEGFQTHKNKVVTNTFTKQNRSGALKKKTSYPPNRFNKHLTSNAKLNLDGLKDKQNDSLVKLYQDYLLLLYKNAPFFQADTIKQIAKITAKKIEAKKDLQEIQTIILPDKKLQKIWYKMLKGTKGYTIQNPCGYPPLLEFMTFEGKTKKKGAINMLKANYILLVALLDKKTSQKILEKEKQESRAIKLSELKILCQEQNIAFTSIKSLIQFSSSKAINPKPDTSLQTQM